MDAVKLHQLANGAASVLSQMAATEPSKVAVSLLDVLIAQYKLDLVEVDPGGLVKVQSCVKQLTELRKVFVGELDSSPKI